jgi:hypothetical protein
VPCSVGTHGRPIEPVRCAHETCPRPSFPARVPVNLPLPVGAGPGRWRVGFQTVACARACIISSSEPTWGRGAARSRSHDGRCEAERDTKGPWCSLECFLLTELSHTKSSSHPAVGGCLDSTALVQRRGRHPEQGGRNRFHPVVAPGVARARDPAPTGRHQRCPHRWVAQCSVRKST